MKKKDRKTRRVEDGAFVTSITGRRVPLLLVDAAPDLLAALKSARETIAERRANSAVSDYPSDQEARERMDFTLGVIDSVIEKAEGEGK